MFKIEAQVNARSTQAGRALFGGSKLGLPEKCQSGQSSPLKLCQGQEVLKILQTLVISYV